MRTLILVLLVTFFCSASFAQTPREVSSKKRGDEYSKRDLPQENAALVERDKLEAMLPPWAKPKLNAAAKWFLHRLLREKKLLTVSKLAEQELAREFGELSPAQSKVLTFYLLTGVIKLIPPHAEKEGVSAKKDGIGKMNEMDMLLLQQMMEKKNQLEVMISNIMKAGFDGGQAAIQALKAS